MVKNIICIAPDCDNTLPENKTKYCSDRCYKRISQRIHRAKEKGETYEIPVKEIILCNKTSGSITSICFIKNGIY